jgi:acyl-CoA thioester hydrolase
MTSGTSRRSTLTSYRVIYGDTDKMGVVYYANYLRWFERGRSEYLRELGVPYGEIEARGIHFPVVEANCQYARPARYEDLILIETTLESMSRASIVFTYRILRHGEENPLATGFTKHACVSPEGKVLRVPADLAQTLTRGLAPNVQKASSVCSD